MISPHKDGEFEFVFCGEVDGEYVGWYPREDADAKGYNYRAPADEAIAALLKATDLAWAAVAANYDTSGGSIAEKQPLWAALAELESALRRIGYVASASLDPL
jgi:hypothetical protein